MSRDNEAIYRIIFDFVLYAVAEYLLPFYIQVTVEEKTISIENNECRDKKEKNDEDKEWK